MTNNKQQTAVKWFLDKLLKDGYIKRLPVLQFQKAKEIEKQKIIDFAKHCLDKALDLDVRTAYSQVEKYYEQTYGGGNR
jgi:hypothetical protein